MTLTSALTDRLKEPRLIAAGGFINGKWNTVSSRGKVFRVANPATGEVLAQIPDLSTHATREAIDAAHAAQPGWAAKSAKERADLLKSLHRLMVENADDLATILTLEMGKPWKEARGEILYGASFIEWFAEEARRVYGDTIPGPPTPESASSSSRWGWWGSLRPGISPTRCWRGNWRRPWRRDALWFPSPRRKHRFRRWRLHG